MEQAPAKSPSILLLGIQSTGVDAVVLRERHRLTLHDLH